MTRWFVPNPSPRHEWRVGLLACLADLTDHHTDLRAWPDGTIPDVLRVNLPQRRIFVGDAKASEHASDADAADRLNVYLGWLTIAVGSGAVGSLVICAPSLSEAKQWSHLVENLLAERSQTTATRLLTLGAGSAVMWAVVASRAAAYPASRGSSTGRSR